ncbi:MAG TPA: Uma2 family endonuclease [Gemmataceae bacterium]|nr:Uma2 family endonuclease [Gemmataceae bacterium]
MSTSPLSGTLLRFTEPRPYRWTRDDYDLLYDAGWFADRRVQLIDGCFIEFPIQSNLHAASVTLTSDELTKAFGSAFWVRILGELNVSRHSLPKPDLAVVPGRPRDYEELDTPTTALLAVEVSETTVDFDRNQKGCLYAASGIADFWIVNPVDRQIEVYRDPLADASRPFGFRYGSRVILDPPDIVSPLALPQAQILVADLLP